MKHVGTMNEWMGQKFFTGHESGEKEKAREYLLSKIKKEIDKMNDGPDSYAYSDDSDRLKDHLIEQAEDNNWKGTIRVTRSRNDDLLYIIYVAGTSPLQDLGGAASSGTRVLGNF